MPLEEKLAEERFLRYLADYKDILKGSVGYDHPEYERIHSNLFGGIRGSRIAARLGS